MFRWLYDTPQRPTPIPEPPVWKAVPTTIALARKEALLDALQVALTAEFDGSGHNMRHNIIEALKGLIDAEK